MHRVAVAVVERRIPQVRIEFPGREAVELAPQFVDLVEDGGGGSIGVAAGIAGCRIVVAASLQHGEDFGSGSLERGSHVDVIGEAGGLLLHGGHGTGCTYVLHRVI